MAQNRRRAVEGGSRWDTSKIDWRVALLLWAPRLAAVGTCVAQAVAGSLPGVLTAAGDAERRRETARAGW